MHLMDLFEVERRKPLAVVRHSGMAFALMALVLMALALPLASLRETRNC